MRFRPFEVSSTSEFLAAWNDAAKCLNQLRTSPNPGLWLRLTRIHLNRMEKAQCSAQPASSQRSLELHP